MGDLILMKFDIKKDLVFWSSYFKFQPDSVILGAVGGGETSILWKHENWGIFIIWIGDRILMKLYI